jgi:transposase
MGKNVNKQRDWREERRQRAWQLHQQGWQQSAIAEALGVTKGAVSQWFKRVREAGVESLRAVKATGAPARLTAEQRQQIPTLLAKGAEAWGFLGDVWTLPRISEVIAREFGVRYHISHVSVLMRQLGYSRQKPVVRATQRDEAAIATWKQKRWPQIKKKL